MSRRFRWILAGIVAAAAAIRFFRLDHFSYGLDEILQAYWLRGSAAFFWHSLRLDGFHPPLDYLIDRALESLHPSDAARKIPAVLFGCGGVAAFGVLLARRAGETAGLVGAALLAAAPFDVRFSQELRPYALGLFLMCLALWALDAFLARPGALRLGLLFLACLATAYAHYTAAFVLALVSGVMLLEDSAAASDAGRRRAARRFLLASPLFVFALWLAYLPWWPVVVDLSRRTPLAARSPGLAGAGRPHPVLLHVRSRRRVTCCRPPAGSSSRWRPAGRSWRSRRRGLRFLAAWGLLGIRLASRRWDSSIPHFDFSRRFVPAGPALGRPRRARRSRRCCAGPSLRLAGAAILAGVLVCDARALARLLPGGTRRLAHAGRLPAARVLARRADLHREPVRAALRGLLPLGTRLAGAGLLRHSSRARPSQPRGRGRPPQLDVEAGHARLARARGRARAPGTAPLGAGVPGLLLSARRARRPAPSGSGAARPAWIAPR